MFFKGRGQFFEHEGNGLSFATELEAININTINVRCSALCLFITNVSIRQLHWDQKKRSMINNIILLTSPLLRGRDSY